MKFLRSLYLLNRLFLCISGLVAAFILTFILDGWVIVPKVLVLVFLSVLLTDLILLYRTRRGLHGYRFVPEGAAETS